MKPSKKIMLLTSCALALFALAACGSNQKQSKEKQASSTVQKSSSDKERYKGSYSNLNSKASVEEVRALLSAYLDQDSVDKFMGLVRSMNFLNGFIKWFLFYILRCFVTLNRVLYHDSLLFPIESPYPIL